MFDKVNITAITVNYDSPYMLVATCKNCKKNCPQLLTKNSRLEAQKNE
jgi:hypothetical protein